MKKLIFIIVRYSVLLKSKTWNIAKESDFEEYRRNLFAKERLDQHFLFFQNVMLPSISSQVTEKNDKNDVEVRLLIITSSELPEAAKQDLSNAISGYGWADTVFLGPEGNLNKAINGYIKSAIAGEKSVYATVRLDDDDALHSDYLSGLTKYLTPGFAGHIISYPRGHAVLFDQELGKVTSAIEVYYPKIALGLALVNCYDDERDAFLHKSMNIFQAGKHTTVQERYQLVLDESLNAYVRMCYKSSDTAEQFFRKRKKISKEVPPKQAFLGFEVKIPLADND